MSELRIEWTPVEASNRLDSVTGGKVDADCGTTTITLSRMKTVEFSLPIYVDGGSVLVRAKSKLARLEDLKGKRIAVIAGTTTEQALARAIERPGCDRRAGPGAERHRRHGNAHAGQGGRLCGRSRRPRQSQAPFAESERLRFRHRGLLVRTLRPADAPRRSRFQARGEPRASEPLPFAATSTRSSSAGWARWASPGPLLHAMFYLSTLPE